MSLEQSGKNLAKAKQIAKDSQGEEIRILLCCEGGLPTNLLMQEVKKVIKKAINSTKVNLILTLYLLMTLKIKLPIGMLCLLCLKLGIN